MANRQFIQHNIQGISASLPDRYVFESILGGGGYGMVMKAWDRNESNYVAIKRLRNPFDNIHYAKRAYRELGILQIVNHKNIIKLLSAYTPQNDLESFSELYFVTEYMDFTLRQIIDIGRENFSGPDGASKMSYLIYQLLCGVNHLHQAGIIHRDLVPENVMIDKHFDVKIIDFGMARMETIPRDMTNLTQVTHRYYRAPEGILTDHYDRKSSQNFCLVDIWSIGCIFAELLTGRILFQGHNDFDQLNQIVSQIGSPSDEYISRLNTASRENAMRLQGRQAIPFEELFPDNIFPPNDRRYTAENGRNFLSKILVFDPMQRVSIEEALRHPYVSWRPKEDELEMPPRGVYDARVENMDMSTQEWKRVIFEAINEHDQNNH